jgi:hypothetical protein
MSTADTLKKSTIDRIKLAAPLTVAMSVPILQGIIVDKQIHILSLEWFYSMLSFFILSTVIVAALMYNYKLLEHLCSHCSSRWSAVESSAISVSNRMVKFNVIKQYFIFKIEKKIKTYTCGICSKVQHKKSRRIEFVCTATEQ